MPGERAPGETRLIGGLDRAMEPPVKRQPNRIESNRRHLLAIINVRLDISSIDAGRMPLQISPFNVSDRREIDIHAEASDSSTEVSAR